MIIDQVKDSTVENNDQFDIVGNLTIIGRGYCGKTCILNRYINDCFDENQEATPLLTEEIRKTVKNKKMLLKVWDTSGQENFYTFRTLTLPISDYVIICYSVDDIRSFYEVTDTLIPMIQTKGKEGVKIILVATKIDVRTDDDRSYEEGLMLSKNIKAFGFYECSSLTGENVNKIFDGILQDMYETNNNGAGGFLSRILFCCN